MMAGAGPASRRAARKGSKTRARERTGVGRPKRSGHGGGSALSKSRFILYVEGPRDRELLAIWAQRICPRLSRSLAGAAVILGGRRPARAVEHFRQQGGSAAGHRGLVVLDRDEHGDDDGSVSDEPALDLFMWTRRHIESYLLVPTALSRFLGRRAEGAPVEQLLAELLPEEDDERVHRALNAKRILGSKGPIARALGTAPSPSEIARVMRRDELHADVVSVCEHIRRGLGQETPEPPIIIRRGGA